MSSPYVGEIRMVAFTFAPQNWLLCDGSLLPIANYDTLFNLIGTTYGGDGVNTFALPDLRSRLPVHQGAGTVLGETGGVETVTLTTNQMPVHSHTPQCAAGSGDATGPAGTVWSAATSNIYGTAGTAVPLAAATVSAVGGSQPHDNLSPYLAVNFIISPFGIYPSPT